MADQEHHSSGEDTISADKEDAPVEPALTAEENALLEEFESLLEKSSAFINTTGLRNYPTQANTLGSLGTTNAKKFKLAQNAKDSYIIVHASLRRLITNFLQRKLENGTQREKDLYENMSVEQFIIRTIAKRPLVFFTGHDITLLRNGNSPSPKDWKKVGKDEQGDIEIEDYMTYDEIQISALVGTSVPTLFINSGDRRNCGQVAGESTFVPEGVYVGLVGARFEKIDCMESCHILIQQDICTAEKGYGSDPVEDESTKMTVELLRTWAEFYDHKPRGKKCYFPTYNEVTNLLLKNNEKYSKIYFSHQPSKWVDKKYINIPVYKSRLLLSILPYLQEANDRAERLGKKAYCHIVGLGLGVWQVSNEQAKWMLEVYEHILDTYALPHISDVNFSWFPDECKSLPNSQRGAWTTACRNEINVIFSKRDPAAPFDGSDDKLLVAMYAWDGNSFPGNEYWRGMLGASGDPAAACCSNIPELQNPEVNPHLTGNPIRFHGNDEIRVDRPIEEEMSEEVVSEEDKEEENSGNEEAKVGEVEGMDEEVKEDNPSAVDGEGPQDDGQ